MHTQTHRRRPVRLAAAGAAALLSALAAPAFAQTPSTVTVSGQVQCVDGRQVITWTATKTVTQLSFAVSIESSSMSGAASGPVVFDPASLPRLGADATSASVSVPGDATGTVTLAVAGTVTVFESAPQPFSSEGEVILPGGCVAVTTTAPATTVPTTSGAPARVATTPRFTG